ncbi:MAG: DciA family protein [Candidatus Nitrotoga sp.]
MSISEFTDIVSKLLSSYFNASQELRLLSHKVDQLLILQRHYEQFAPPSLTRNSHVVQIDQQTLIVAADNGTVAAKLRQLAPELTKSFQNREYEITGIQIRVQVALPISILPPRLTSLSNAGRQQLVDFSVKLQDSPLKSALQRLAKNEK